MTKKEPYRTLTIRLPVRIWKKLKQAIMEGRLKSIQQAVVESLERYLGDK